MPVRHQIANAKKRHPESAPGSVALSLLPSRRCCVRRSPFFALLALLILLAGCAEWAPPAAPLSRPPDRSAAKDAPASPATPHAAGSASHELEVLPGITPGSSAPSAAGVSLLRDPLTQDGESVLQPAPLRVGAADSPLADAQAAAAPTNALDAADTEGGDLLLSIEGMELNRFIHLVFGRHLGVNYMVDPQVEKRSEPVTIHMQQSVDRTAFFRLVREMLEKYSVTARESGGTWFIEPSKGQASASDMDFMTLVGRSIPEGLADSQSLLLLMPLAHVEVNQALASLNSMFKPGAGNELRPVGDKAVALRGDAGTARKLLDLLALVDQPFFQDQQVRLLALRYIDVATMMERLGEILPPLGIPVSVAGKGVGVSMVPIPEISSLLLVSPESSWLQIIQAWADRLDTPAVLGPEPRIFIFHPQNRKAEELAEVILGLRGEKKKDKALDKDAKTTERKVTEKTAVNPASRTRQEEQSALHAAAGPEPAAAPTVLRNEELSITVDTNRNALVIFTSPEIYAEVERNLRDLDTQARQVLIEVTIAEVTLTDDLQYGVEWYLRNLGPDWNYEIQTLEGLGIGSSGVLATFSRSSGDFLSMLNAFAQNDLVKILATPRLVVLDNESASFSVGTDVPVVTSEATASDLATTSETPSVLRNVQYRKTGVSMDVTPTIYSDGMLRLEIDQALSEAQKNDVSPETDSPLILDRTLNTVVTLRSAEYILIAGLISETKSNGNQRIPLLGDIPYLGNLFKTSSSQVTRTELMIQVRPIILDSADDARYETQKYEATLRELRGLAKEVLGDGSGS